MIIVTTVYHVPPPAVIQYNRFYFILLYGRRCICISSKSTIQYTQFMFEWPFFAFGCLFLSVSPSLSLSLYTALFVLFYAPLTHQWLLFLDLIFPAGTRKFTPQFLFVSLYKWVCLWIDCNKALIDQSKCAKNGGSCSCIG